MTEEEYQREQAEAEQLRFEIDSTIAAINRVNSMNVALNAELNDGLRNIGVLIGNFARVGAQIESRMNGLSNQVGEARIDTREVFDALNMLTEKYTAYKNISEASKNLTMYTDEYYTRFSYYGELRRITLGYVIGLDLNIISDEASRKKVEKAYLQNTDYWLAYCIMAVMLWKSDEREAAERALSKSLSMDYFNACLFYLLINLRFGRIEAAEKWYICYLEHSDMENLGDEWQYLLRAYLLGAFGADADFQSRVADRFRSILHQAEITTVGFAERFSDKSKQFAELFLHRTEREFPTLRRTCREYAELFDLLSDVEKNPIIARYYCSLAEAEGSGGDDMPQRIENVLYSLINDYDESEFKVVRKIKENEAIVEAQGDVSAAQAKIRLLFGDEKRRRNFGDMMLEWAFADETARTANLEVKRFSISFMKEPIQRGLKRFADECTEREPEKCGFDIDGCFIECTENGYDEKVSEIEAFYNKNRMKNLVRDKQVRIYAAICAAAIILLLVLIAFFSPVILTAGILAGLAGSFLLWRRIVDLDRIREENKRQSKLLFRKALTELSAWRAAFGEESAKSGDMLAALDKF